jgi:hypothetical protein
MVKLSIKESSNRQIPYDLVSSFVILRDYADLEDNYVNNEHKMLVDIADSLYNADIKADDMNKEYQELYKKYKKTYFNKVLKDIRALKPKINRNNVSDFADKISDKLEQFESGKTESYKIKEASHGYDYNERVKIANNIASWVFGSPNPLDVDDNMNALIRLGYKNSTKDYQDRIFMSDTVDELADVLAQSSLKLLMSVERALCIDDDTIYGELEYINKMYGESVRHRKLHEQDVEIEVENEGILEVPKNKNVDDLPFSHFEKLAKKKGLSKITRALNNLQVWNKNSNKKLSKWAGDMIDKLNNKLKEESYTMNRRYRRRFNEDYLDVPTPMFTRRNTTENEELREFCDFLDECGIDVLKVARGTKTILVKSRDLDTASFYLQDRDYFKKLYDYGWSVASYA